MDADWNLIGPANLHFFGKMTSTSTHELSNSLGIINEQAGLLEDLGWISKQGKTIDIDRWIDISKKIASQIQQTNHIIKNLNKFAHSTDNKSTTNDINSLIALVTSLSTRIMAEKDVTIDLKTSTEPLMVSIAPFLFLNLIDNCLIFARDNVDNHHKISIHCNLNKEELIITFSGLNIVNTKKSSEIIKSELLGFLKAGIHFPKGNECFQISINTEPQRG